MKLFAFTGVAGSGKDTAWKAVSKILETAGFKTKRIAFADIIRQDLDPIFREKYGVDIWNLPREEKELYRPIMVHYGLVHRKKTKGLYLIERVKKQIESEPDTIFGLTDVRYKEYDYDEPDFLRENGATLVHVTRFLNGKAVGPANEQEAANDPILKKLATHHIEWDSNLDENYHLEKVKTVLS